MLSPWPMTSLQTCNVTSLSYNTDALSHWHRSSHDLHTTRQERISPIYCWRQKHINENVGDTTTMPLATQATKNTEQCSSCNTRCKVSLCQAAPMPAPLADNTTALHYITWEFFTVAYSKKKTSRNHYGTVTMSGYECWNRWVFGIVFNMCTATAMIFYCAASSDCS